MRVDLVISTFNKISKTTILLWGKKKRKKNVSFKTSMSANKYPISHPLLEDNSHVTSRFELYYHFLD